ncbi:MAG: CoA-binding protein [Anaerolineales bacterium]|nr:CoA-binding protein [Anaerolineales bacterium]MCB9126517.1 CoA-binding protein [Ardenticatenales bacterium]
MANPVEEFVALRRWAVVGASQERHKFGNIILRRLHQAGYQVVGVHPNGEPVDGIPVYPTLADIPEAPDVVNIVVPPSVTERIVEMCYTLGIRRIWMQPGAQSQAAIAFCHAHGMRVVADGSCALVHHRRWSE